MSKHKKTAKESSQEDCECRVKHCQVEADGHCGCIEVSAGELQIVYLQSLALTLPVVFGGRQFVTLTNEGPGTLAVWIDTLPSQSIQLQNGLAGPPVAGSQPQLDPVAANLDPLLQLQPGQSVTVAVATVVLVQALGAPATGCYVLSWCCPEGLKLHVNDDGNGYGYKRGKKHGPPPPKQ